VDSGHRVLVFLVIIINIIIIIAKSRGMTWAGHVTRMGMMDTFRVLTDNSEQP
jgi:hypothetical protein